MKPVGIRVKSSLEDESSSSSGGFDDPSQSIKKVCVFSMSNLSFFVIKVLIFSLIVVLVGSSHS